MKPSEKPVDPQYCHPAVRDLYETRGPGECHYRGFWSPSTRYHTYQNHCVRHMGTRPRWIQNIGRRLGDFACAAWILAGRAQRAGRHRIAAALFAVEPVLFRVGSALAGHEVYGNFGTKPIRACYIRIKSDNDRVVWRWFYMHVHMAPVRFGRAQDKAYLDAHVEALRRRNAGGLA